MTVEDCKIGIGVQIYDMDLVNVYGCEIGARTTVSPFVEIQRGARIGNDCRISSHSFICGGMRIGNGVFMGHGVITCNDPYPVVDLSFPLLPPIIEDGVSIGSGVVILPGVRIGEGAIIGAGTVVAKDVPSWTVVSGNPQRIIREFSGPEEREAYVEKKRHDLHPNSGC